MGVPRGQEELSMRYLLRTLSEDERERLEEHYFSDDADFEELEIAEEELIDQYVRGELSASDAERFERTIAISPRLIERVQFAKVFAGNLAAPTEVRPVVADEQVTWWQRWFGASHRLQFASVFGLLLVFVGAGALTVGWLRLQQESSRLTARQTLLEQQQRDLEKQAAELKAQADQLAKSGQQLPDDTTDQPVPQPPEPKTSAPVFLTLFPGTPRSSGRSNTVRILPTTNEVRITLNVGDPDHSSYRVAFMKDNRTQVFSAADLRTQTTNRGGTITVRVPAKALSSGDYVINLFGGTANEPVADYQFRVMR